MPSKTGKNLLYCIGLTVLVAFPASGICYAAEAQKSSVIAMAVSKISYDSARDDKLKDAMHLKALIEHHKVGSISDEDIYSVASLLSNDSADIRNIAADILVQIGSRAQLAAPALLRALELRELGETGPHTGVTSRSICNAFVFLLIPIPSGSCQ